MFINYLFSAFRVKEIKFLIFSILEAFKHSQIITSQENDKNNKGILESWIYAKEVVNGLWNDMLNGELYQ